jgi:hypothetical protein
MSTNRDNRGSSTSAAASGLVNSVDQMVRLPLQMTGATWDLMVQGVRSMTGAGRQPRPSSMDGVAEADSSMSSTRSGRPIGNDQDLGGDDLKYVVWSIVFTKPGFECVLEPQRSELVNYSADGASFAAVKIAKVLERARHGHVEKAESWREHGYPPESPKSSARRTDVINSADAETTAASGTSPGQGAFASNDRGWRIPADDHKYITFLYRVDWRLPKPQPDVTRVERVTIERPVGTSRIV